MPLFGAGWPGAGNAARLGASGGPGGARVEGIRAPCPDLLEMLPSGPEWSSGLFIRTLWLPARPQLTDRLCSGCVRAPSVPACGEQTSGSPALRHECAICCCLATAGDSWARGPHGRSRPLPSSFPSLGQILPFRDSPPFVPAQVSGDCFSPPDISRFRAPQRSGVRILSDTV